MQLKGEQLIRADRQSVWAALNDPAILKQSIEGCQSLARVSDDQLEGVVAASIGPVKASFKGLVTLSNLNPPESYTITGEGKGGAAGFAKGSADVTLSESPEGTLLRYAVSAQVGGKLAQIGARLVDAAAQKYATSFFERFRQVVETPAGTADAAAPAAVQPPAAETGLPAWLWAGVLIALVALVLAALLMR